MLTHDCQRRAGAANKTLSATYLKFKLTWVSWIWFCKICQAFTQLSPRFRLQWTKAASSSSRYQTPLKKKKASTQYQGSWLLYSLDVRGNAQAIKQRASKQAQASQCTVPETRTWNWKKRFKAESKRGERFPLCFSYLVQKSNEGTFEQRLLPLGQNRFQPSHQAKAQLSSMYW